MGDTSDKARAHGPSSLGQSLIGIAENGARRALEGAAEASVDYIRDTAEGRRDEDAAIRAQSIATAEANRGTPHPDRSVLYQQWRNAGQARLRTLTERFGQDAMVLGHLLFKIPPLAVRIRKSNITYRWKPLRTKESIAVPSGSGEAWIEVDLAFVGLNQINNSLGGLITLWKKAPICFIENLYIRENMLPENDVDSMAVRLENLVIDVAAGTPDAVWVTAMMCWFNWKPFSQNFWFREFWSAADEPSNSPAAETRTFTQREGSPSIPGALSTIVDLSALETPGLLSSSTPTEVRLSHETPVRDPGDPLVLPTQPVVYPFNSRPFMDYMSSGPDVAPPISEWTDNVTMNWKSLKRLIVPSNWRWDANNPPTVSTPVVVAPPPLNSPVMSPVPVTDGKDVIIFMGDSIMSGFLGLISSGSSNQESTSDDPLRAWNGSQRFAHFGNFVFYTAVKTGTNTTTALSWWRSYKNENRLKISGQGPLSRVAGIVIHLGINDSEANWNNGRTIANLREIMSDVSGAGGIAVLLPLPPEGNAPTVTCANGSPANGRPADKPNHTHVNPPYHPQMSPMTASWIASVDNYHAQMVGLAGGISQAMGPSQIDYHETLAGAGCASSRALAWKTEYMIRCIPTTGKHNLHPNGGGYTAIANYVRPRLPWNSLAGRGTASQTDVWTITAIDDGDTLSVRQGDTNKVLRLFNIDTPETYGSSSSTPTPNGYDMPSGGYSSADVLRWMPRAQDSWRPEEYCWGTKAKAKLIELSGGVGSTIRVETAGQDYYGRELATIFKGDLNINMRLVELGLAWASVGGTDGTLGGPYLMAEQAAGGTGSSARDPKVGMWAHRHAELAGAIPTDMPADIRSLLEDLIVPKDFRTQFPSGENTWRMTDETSTDPS